MADGQALDSELASGVQKSVSHGTTSRGWGTQPTGCPPLRGRLQSATATPLTLSCSSSIEVGIVRSNHQRTRARWQHLQRLQVFDDRIAVVITKCVESLLRPGRLAVMRPNGLADGRKFSVMHIRSFVREAPQLASQEKLVARGEFR